MRSGRGWAVGALAVILAITVAWWALALWPLPDTSPAWLLRTRAVCFGTSPTGLPDAYGWMTLIGEPVLMLGMLFVIWGDAVRAELAALYGSRVGRGALGAATTLLLIACGAAGARVASATRAGVAPLRLADAAPATTTRMHRPAPPLDLVDQHGQPVTLARFRGRPVLVAFGYAHCETVCPLVVRDVLRARELAGDHPPAVIVVTLDPWRDTPARLPAIAAQWQLSHGALVAGGDTGRVTAVLERWNVAAHRDLRTGTIAHATPVYVIDRAGQVAYVVSGAAGAAALAELARQL